MCEKIPEELTSVMHNFFSLFFTVLVVALVIFCIVDLLKILTSQDEQTIRNRQNMLFKRILAGVLAFLVIYIIQFIFGVMNLAEANDAVQCAKRIILGK